MVENRPVPPKPEKERETPLFPCEGKCRICPFPGLNCRDNTKDQEVTYVESQRTHL